MLGLRWIAAYTAALVGAVALAAGRRRSTLVTGAGVLRFTALAALVPTVAVAAATGRVPLALAAPELLAFAGAWSVRDSWLIFRCDTGRFGSVLERCLGMLRARHERVPARAGGYVVPLAGAALRIGVRSVGGAVVVTFRGARGHRKAELVRALLAKQFDGVVPRIKLATRR